MFHVIENLIICIAFGCYSIHKGIKYDAYS